MLLSAVILDPLCHFEDRMEQWPPRHSFDLVIGADVVYLEDGEPRRIHCSTQVQKKYGPQHPTKSFKENLLLIGPPEHPHSVEHKPQPREPWSLHAPEPHKPRGSSLGLTGDDAESATPRRLVIVVG